MKTLFFPFSLLLLLIDISFFSLLQTPLVHSLLCFFTVSLFHAVSYSRLSILLALLSLESLLYFDRLGYTLFYLIPLMMIGIQAQTLFYANFLHKIIFLFLCIGAQTFFTTTLLYHTSAPIIYTGVEIFVNIIIVMLLSLSVFKGAQGSRF